MRSLKLPLPRILCAYVFGVFAAIYIPQPALHGLSLPVLATGLLLLALSTRAGLNWQGIPYLQGMLAMVCCMSAGICLTQLNDERNRSDYISKKKYNSLLGRCDEEPTLYPRASRFKFAVFAGRDQAGRLHPASGKVLVDMQGRENPLHFQDMAELSGVLGELQPAPGPHSFDMRAYLGFHHVHRRFSVAAGGLLAHVLAGPGLRLAAFHIQEQAAGLIKSTMGDSPAASFLSALLLGSRSSMDPGLYQAFGTTGTVHIISVSGLHVQIVYAVFAWLFPEKILKRRWRWMKIARRVILSLLVILYALISGLSPAVCRSAAMIACFILAEGLPTKMETSMVYFASAFFILLLDPWALADPGFQLSYLAVGSLIFFQEKISGIFKPLHPLLKFLWGTCSCSLAAQVLTLPLCLFYFHQYPLYFIFANMVIIPITSLMLYVGLFQLGLTMTCLPFHMPGLPALAAWVSQRLFKLMSESLLFFARLPHASLKGYFMSWDDLWIWYAAMLISFAWIYNKKTWTLTAASLLWSFLLGSGFFSTLENRAQKRSILLALGKKPLLIHWLGEKAFLSRTCSLKEYERYVQPELQAANTRLVCLQQAKNQAH